VKQKLVLLALAFIFSSAVVEAHVPILEPGEPLTIQGGTYSRYMASTSFPPTIAATDIMVLSGAASWTICVTDVRVSGITSSAANLPFSLIKRSTADSGGTSVAVTPTPLDSLFPAAQATAKYYTANPTLGTQVGQLNSTYVPISVNTAAASSNYASIGTKSTVALRGTGEQLAVSLGSSTITTNNSMRVGFEWYEVADAGGALFCPY
jgi:hypothetical protein